MNESTEILESGRVGIIPTDTLYGIVGQALKRDTVERIYQLKRRSPTKPFIILIGDITDLELFGITPNKNVLNRYWPGPVSVILDCPDSRTEYLHRATHTLAFRLPNNPELIELLKTTGPLVAPSANPEGLQPAQNIDEAKAYFGDQVDFYLEGPVSDKPSKIIKLTGDSEEIIRP